MDETSKKFLNDAGINFENLEDLDGQMIPRELLLNPIKYDELKERIMDLKKLYSSSSLTGLQNGADAKQKWPLLNIVRQLLNVYKMEMEPVRKSDGYSPNGVKKYKRYFVIKKMHL
jgi:hypothetical protein